MVDIYSLGGVVFTSSNGVTDIVKHGNLFELKQDYKLSLLPHPNNLINKDYFINYFAENYPNHYVTHFDVNNKLKNGDKDYLTLIEIKSNVVVNIVTFRYVVNDDCVYIGMIDNDEVQWFDKAVFGKDVIKNGVFYFDGYHKQVQKLIQLKDI